MKPPCIKSSTDTCFYCSVVKIITPDNDKKTLLMINYVGRVMCSDVKKKKSCQSQNVPNRWQSVPNTKAGLCGGPWGLSGP